MTEKAHASVMPQIAVILQMKLGLLEVLSLTGTPHPNQNLPKGSTQFSHHLSENSGNVLTSVIKAPSRWFVLFVKGQKLYEL